MLHDALLSRANCRICETTGTQRRASRGFWDPELSRTCRGSIVKPTGTHSCRSGTQGRPSTRICKRGLKSLMKVVVVGIKAPKLLSATCYSLPLFSDQSGRARTSLILGLWTGLPVRSSAWSLKLATMLLQVFLWQPVPQPPVD